jgi:hypothetical protein
MFRVQTIVVGPPTIDRTTASFLVHNFLSGFLISCLVVDAGALSGLIIFRSRLARVCLGAGGCLIKMSLTDEAFSSRTARPCVSDP